MSTGLSDLNRGGRGAQLLPSRSVLYVADVTSGMAGAYAIPFNSTQHVSGRYFESPLALICGFPIRKVMARADERDKAGICRFGVGE